MWWFVLNAVELEERWLYECQINKYSVSYEEWGRRMMDGIESRYFRLQSSEE